MSYSLSISGHHNDAAVAEQIDTLVAEKGAEIVAAVLALDPTAVAHANFSGPTFSRNFLTEPKAATPPDEPYECIPGAHTHTEDGTAVPLDPEAE